MGKTKNLAERLRERTKTVQRTQRVDEQHRAADEHQENLRKARAALPRMADALKRAAHEATNRGGRTTHVCVGAYTADTNELIALLTQWAKRHGFRGKREHIDGGTDMGGFPCSGYSIFKIEW